MATLLNDDVLPALTISDATVVEGDQGSSLATFTVTLSSNIQSEARVNFTIDDGTAKAGTDYVDASGAVVCGSHEPRGHALRALPG